MFRVDAHFETVPGTSSFIIEADSERHAKGILLECNENWIIENVDEISRYDEHLNIWEF